MRFLYMNRGFPWGPFPIFQRKAMNYEPFSAFFPRLSCFFPLREPYCIFDHSPPSCYDFGLSKFPLWNSHTSVSWKTAKSIFHPFQVPVGPIVSILSMKMAKITIFGGPWIPHLSILCPFPTVACSPIFRPVSAIDFRSSSNGAKALWFTSMMSKRLSASSMVIPSSPSFFTKPGILKRPGRPEEVSGFFDDWYMLISYVYICVCIIYIYNIYI